MNKSLTVIFMAVLSLSIASCDGEDGVNGITGPSPVASSTSSTSSTSSISGTTSTTSSTDDVDHLIIREDIKSAEKNKNNNPVLPIIK